MDAIKFIKDRNRICKTYFTQGCRRCPFEGITGCNHLQFMIGKEEDIVSIVEQWVEEHPPKSILQDLLEKYPKTMLMSGTPHFCPSNLGYDVSECDQNLDVSCEECWNRPLY